MSDATSASLSPEELAREIQSRQSLPLGLAAGAIASVAGAALWALITVVTHYQIGYLAVAIGFIVGFAIRIAGRGLTPSFGVMGAALALFGCLLGNFLSLIGFISINEQMGYFEVLTQIDYTLLPQIMVDTFQPIDLLFYGLALAAGYRYSFRKISDEEFSQLGA